MHVDDGMEHCLNLRPRQMRVGAIGKHRDIVQNQVELGGQPARRHAASRSQAHGNMRPPKAIGKRAGCTAPPVMDRMAAKDVESHFSSDTCEAAVSRRAVQQLPSQAGFVSNFMGSGASGWGGRVRTSESLGPNPLK
jgi:hypothetical protein